MEPASAESVVDVRTGVRWMEGLMVSRASRTEARVRGRGFEDMLFFLGCLLKGPAPLDIYFASEGFDSLFSYTTLGSYISRWVSDWL